MVWAAGVKVAGSSPTGGILAKMCECVCNAFTHSLARNFPSVGIEHGPISLQTGRLPRSQTSQLGPGSSPDYFVNYVMVWAAWVKVVGSSPAGGILSKMCECECNAFTHSMAHKFPSSALEHGSAPLKSGRLPISKTSQLGHPRLPPYRPGNRGTRISYYSCPLSGA